MLRRVAVVAMPCALACAFGAALALWATHRPPKIQDPPALVMRMREVARLETLDVSLYKKVSFEPSPEPTDSLLGDALTWAKFTLHPPHGKAIIFAEVHIGLDLSKMSASDIRPAGRSVEVHLPPLVTSVELRPGETEVIGSNLDSQQTAQLFEVAREAFGREAARDRRLQDHAEASAERALGALFSSLGYREVVFQKSLAAPAAL